MNNVTDLVVQLAVLLLVALLIAVIYLLRRRPHAVTIFEYQAGLRYRYGKLVGTLQPGRYSLLWPGTHITVVDLREQVLAVQGQEMLTSENLGVKVSVTARHRTSNAATMVHSAQSVPTLLYTGLQIALRKAVAARTLENLLQDRTGVADELMVAIAPVATASGVDVLSVDVRDLMLSGETKRAYTDLFRAKKDGETALERARSETAALRNLANGARLLQGNPALFNLRLLQTLTTSAAKGATVVLNTSGTTMMPMGPQVAEPRPETGE